MNPREPAAGDRGEPDTAPARTATRLTVVPDEPLAECGATLAVGFGPGRAANTRRGSLLAVCGLCGGAGTSTLAYLIALAAARTNAGPVLVADTGGPGGGISCYAGVQAPRSLPEQAELAEHLTACATAGQLVASSGDGVRVLATGPRFAPACADQGVELLLAQARERYALSVIDCGTLARAADQIALASASQVAWVLPATAGGVLRADRVLDALDPSLPGRELLLARHDERGQKAAHRDLKRLAQLRHATLVLVPTLPDLATSNADAALEAAQVPLQAILGALSRQ